MNAACSGQSGCSRAPLPGSHSGPAGRSTTNRRSLMGAFFTRCSSSTLLAGRPRAPSPGRRASGSARARAWGRGRVGAPDLVAATTAAVAAGVTVALVEQPYQVAGRRSPAPAAQLDQAWTAVVEQLRTGALSELRLLVGGRSSGARVACRTAGGTHAAGVLCLAFPLRPPGRASAPSRLPNSTPSRCRRSSSRASATLSVRRRHRRCGRSSSSLATTASARRGPWPRPSSWLSLLL